ncbi:MAG: uroporphyrinogen decarboxylase family protein [Verrucomicrobiota bacterium]
MKEMTSRERVLATLDFEPVDRLPKDLGGMASTGISAFAYPKLVEALGLPYRKPRVYDTYQMLAYPDADVLDALGCDVACIYWGSTNELPEEDKWHDFDFNGRLDAQVRYPEDFEVLKDGTITQPRHGLTMPPSSVVFDEAHGGQSLDYDSWPHPDLDELRKDLEVGLLSDEQVQEIVDHCKLVRESTDRAIFFNGPIMIGTAIGGWGGMGIYPMFCMLEPELAEELHELTTEYAVKQVERLLPAIAPYIDIVMMASDDWGTQTSLIASPDVYEELFKPYQRRVNEACHRVAPEVKTFLHSCGAIYPILDGIIEAGFDVINPIQWSAGGHSYKEWKDKCRGRIAMWGGGVNSQGTLPLGSVEDVAREAGEVSAYLAQDSGYVFNNIHNILAEIEPEKIIAMYKAAS